MRRALDMTSRKNESVEMEVDNTLFRGTYSGGLVWYSVLQPAARAWVCASNRFRRSLAGAIGQFYEPPNSSLFHEIVPSRIPSHRSCI
jgi:hypothetical protein